MRGLKNRRGAVLIFVFVILVGLSGIVFAFLTMVSGEIKSAGAGLLNTQAFYIAEAGLAKARWALTDGGETIGWGEPDTAFGEGTYTVTTTDNGDTTYTITSDGYIPDDINTLAKRRVMEENILASPASGNNISEKAVASASSVQGSNTADRSNDGDTGTRWRSNIKNGSWLRHDFGSSTTFNKIVFIESQIDSYTIGYSDNGSSYNAVTGALESPAGTVTFDSVTARYLRLSVNGNRPSVYELETYNTAGTGVSLGQGEYSTAW